MRSRANLLRLVAFVLLFGMAFDFVVMDLYGRSPQIAGTDSLPLPSCDDIGARHDCFCCCSHLIVTPQVSISVALAQTVESHHIDETAPDTEIGAPFHPPKA